MKTRSTRYTRDEMMKLNLAIVFGLGLLIKVAFVVFEVSTVQASQVATILLK